MKDIIIIVLTALIFIGLAILLYRAFKHAPYDNNPTEWHDPPITEAMREKQAWLKRIQMDEFGKYPGSGPAERAEPVFDAEKVSDIVHQMREEEKIKWDEISRHANEVHRALDEINAEGFDDDRR
jgi:hypothetical protein